MKMKTIYPEKPLYSYNEWINYIRDSVTKHKGLNTKTPIKKLSL